MPTRKSVAQTNRRLLKHDILFDERKGMTTSINGHVHLSCFKENDDMAARGLRTIWKASFASYRRKGMATSIAGHYHVLRSVKG